MEQLPTAVFILGAGASAQGGCPVMADFFDVAKQLYSEDKIRHFEDHYKTVQRFRLRLQDVLSKSAFDIDNLETVYTAAEFLESIEPGLRGMPKSVTQSMTSLIVGVLQETQKYRTTKFKVADGLPAVQSPSGYNELGGLVSSLSSDYGKREVGFITFNYDLGIETALQYHSHCVDYCFGNDTLEPTNKTQSTLSIKVCKLHGSLNWILQDKNLIVAFDPLRELRNQADDREGETRLNCGRALGLFDDTRDTNSLPLIVPPSDSKHRFRSTMKGVWQSAFDLLRRAEHIFIIGYSIPVSDQFFRHFFALSMLDSLILRKIWLFDPSDTGTVDKRFEALLGPAVLNRNIFEPYQLHANHAVEHISETLRLQKHSF